MGSWKEVGFGLNINLGKTESSISREALGEVAGKVMPHFMLVGQLCKEEDK